MKQILLLTALFFSMSLKAQYQTRIITNDSLSLIGKVVSDVGDSLKLKNGDAFLWVKKSNILSIQSTKPAKQGLRRKFIAGDTLKTTLHRSYLAGGSIKKSATIMLIGVGAALVGTGLTIIAPLSKTPNLGYAGIPFFAIGTSLNIAGLVSLMNGGKYLTGEKDY